MFNSTGSEANMPNTASKQLRQALVQACIGVLVASVVLAGHVGPAEAKSGAHGGKPPSASAGPAAKAPAAPRARADRPQAAPGAKPKPQGLATPQRAAPAPKNRTYQTYVKTSRDGKKDYAGRTSGTGTPLENVARRDRNHQRNPEGYGPARLDRSSKNKDAIRGREQQLIDRARESGRSSGQMNGVSPRNPNKDRYINAAKKEFGK